jgi:DNA-binding response OmpR family regulator
MSASAVCQPVSFFISYNHRDVDWAEWIAWQLENDGYRTILQAWDFKAGSSFVVEMDNALKRADRIIAVLSPGYLDSNFTPSEWAAKFAEDPQGRNGKVIPVRGTDVLVQGLLSPIIFIDLVGKDEIGARYELLTKLKRERAKPDHPPYYPGKCGAPPQFPPTASSNNGIPQQVPNSLTQQVDVVEFTAVITGTITIEDVDLIEAIVEHLRKRSKDAFLTLLKARHGSVVLLLRGSRAGFQELERLHKEGLLNEVNGCKLLGFGINHSPTELIQPRSGSVNKDLFSNERDLGLRILIAEDDAPLATFIAKAFKSEDHVTEIALSGDGAIKQLQESKYDLLILDLNLPVVSGSEVLAKVRSRDPDIPILILTATDEVTERVACLNAGADDYLTKPFSFSELSARIHAVLRRKNSPGHAVLKSADLELDYLRRTVHRAGRLVDLTPKEFDLLEYFMRNPGRRITRNMIIEYMWKLSPRTMTNVVDVYINYLRKKIDEGANVKLIRTIRGVGYEFGTGEATQEESDPQSSSA